MKSTILVLLLSMSSSIFAVTQKQFTVEFDHVFVATLPQLANVLKYKIHKEADEFCSGADYSIQGVKMGIGGHGADLVENDVLLFKSMNGFARGLLICN